MLPLSDHTDSRLSLTQAPRTQGPLASNSGGSSNKFEPGQHPDGPADIYAKHVLLHLADDKHPKNGVMFLFRFFLNPDC